jgi:hypothetical protein
MSDTWFVRQRQEWIAETVRIFGFINREHIERKFGVSTPQASIDLAAFQTNHPGNAMRLEFFAQRIAARVCDAELQFCRALGMSEFDAACQAFRILDETYLSVFAADRPAVWPTPRTVTGTR